MFGLGLAVLPATAPADEPTAPGDVQFREMGYGWLLTDTQGMTLYEYAFDQTPNESRCTDECARRWPPLLVSNSDEAPPSGEWAHVSRDDGSIQWAYRGKPLYRFTGDQRSGNLFGDGFMREWTAAWLSLPTPRGVQVVRSDLGHVFAVAGGGALYFSSEEVAGRFTCDATCARSWRPLLAPRLASALPGWSVVTRADGTRQWAYRDMPVYEFAGDRLAGETRGHGLESWRAVVLEPRPSNPGWVGVHMSDASVAVLTDPQGRTLYTRNTLRLRGYSLAAARPCDPECPGSPWEPVLVEPSHERPAPDDPHWSVYIREDGSEQWAYNGVQVYVNQRDGRMPGLLNGIRGGDRSWTVLTQSGGPIPGTM